MATDRKYIKVDGRWIKADKIGYEQLKSKIVNITNEPKVENIEYDDVDKDDTLEIIRDVAIGIIVYFMMGVLFVALYSIIILNNPQLGIAYMLGDVVNILKLSPFHLIFGYGEVCFAP